jgi:AraC family transcriptional regulator, melibiose operon regulatory protein
MGRMSRRLNLHDGLVSESGPPNVMAQPHHHDHIELNYLEHGAMTYLLSGHEFTIAAGRLLAFWAAVPHQVTWIAPDTRLHWLYVPLRLVLEWDLPAALLEQALHGVPLIDQPTQADLGRFRAWHSDLAAQQVDMDHIVQLEVEARLRRLALHVTAPQYTAVRADNGALLKPARQMALYIARHHAEPLTVQQVAATVNLHPNYAMQIFRDQIKTSMLEYLTRHRVAHAQRLLLTTDQRIIDIALEAGFGSPSRFYAVFKHFCGQSPGQYRRVLRGTPIS